MALPEFVESVSAGVQYSIAVTVSGAMYSWGKSNGGQLGVTPDSEVPTANLCKLEPAESKEEESKSAPVEAPADAAPGNTFKVALIQKEPFRVPLPSGRVVQKTCCLQGEQTVVLLAPRAQVGEVSRAVVYSGYTFFCSLSLVTSLVSLRVAGPRRTRWLS